MRTLTYYVGMTIDAFIAGPAGEVDFFDPAEDVLRHLAAEHPDTIPTHVRAAMGLGDDTTRFDAVVMGRSTYAPALELGITSPYAHLDQYVFSSRLSPSPDPAVHIMAADPVATVRDLKAKPGKGIWLAGGGDLAGQLLPIIDELVLKVYPVVAGAGVRLFAAGFDVTGFEPVDIQSFASGTVITTYARRGAPAGAVPA